MELGLRTIIWKKFNVYFRHYSKEENSANRVKAKNANLITRQKISQKDLILKVLN
jgi:hypothetical protein